VIRSPAFIDGPANHSFEQDFAFYCEVDHCIGLANGTIALELALRAAGIGQGDEVIVPALTFIATAAAVVWAGARPVFCDVDRTGLLDPEQAEGLIGPKTRAIIPCISGARLQR
jgi:dTDP-4-amino-4,6-dideoxygalactose transaminase